MITACGSSVWISGKPCLEWGQMKKLQQPVSGHRQPPVAGQADEGVAQYPSTEPPLISSGVFIKEVRIRNFRCLRSVDVELDPLTVCIGQNNSGKTSFLSALFAAIGAGQRIISNDDIFLHKGEASAPKGRVIAIDILIRAHRRYWNAHLCLPSRKRVA